MRFTTETVNVALFEEVSPLLVKHYREIAHYPDIELDPDWESYAKVSEMGNLRVFGARTGPDSKLVGYAVYFVRANMHYKNSLQAVQDVLFVDPDYRGRGGAFIKFCDEQLKAEGVQVTYHHIKAAHNFGPMLERIGYTLVDLIYSRRLDKETT